jgi:predicted O-methyltransferase YrrM
MTLNQFAKNHHPRTDKYDLGYIDEFYHDLFSPRVNSVTNLLEIGTSEGHSVMLWRDFFPNALINCVDINPCPEYLRTEPRINAFSEDAYTHNFVDKFPKKFFDIVIDDGPHTFETMQFFLTNYLPLVKPGGLLILEDIIDPAWTPELLKLIDPNVSKVTTFDMRGKQNNGWLLDRWKNGLDVIVVEK